MRREESLANKYRPKTFDDVSEQESIKRILTNQIQTGNLKHSYLFCGGAGTGKTTSARIIANMMNGGECNPIELDCASNNGVDDVRWIIEQCSTLPLSGKYKIFILDEAHMLTPQAWNAMLKILEEPPSYVIFIFCTTDPQKILGTILSRVQRFNFSRISTAGIVSRLTYILQQENINTFEPQAVEYIARLAKGGMRESITTLEKCLDYDCNLTLDNVLKVVSGGIDERCLLQFLYRLVNKDCKEAIISFEDIYMSGADVSLFVKLLNEFIVNSIKYLVTLVPDIVPLSEITISWLSENQTCLMRLKELLYSMEPLNNRYSSEDLKILVESWIVKICS